MTLHPQAQTKAQVEIDALLSPSGRLDRLPIFTDKKNLPYVGAVIKEVFRWFPVLPLAVPHRAMRDDVYKGYFIPKDASVIGNVWSVLLMALVSYTESLRRAILNDVKLFVDPGSFNPDRFIDEPSLPNPADLGIFGFGRRCT